MEYIALIALFCSPSKTQALCESSLKECVQWVVKQPEAAAKDISELDATVWILGDVKARLKLCK